MQSESFVYVHLLTFFFKDLTNEKHQYIVVVAVNKGKQRLLRLQTRAKYIVEGQCKTKWNLIF